MFGEEKSGKFFTKFCNKSSKSFLVIILYYFKQSFSACISRLIATIEAHIVSTPPHENRYSSKLYVSVLIRGILQQDRRVVDGKDVGGSVVKEVVVDIHVDCHQALLNPLKHRDESKLKCSIKSNLDKRNIL